MTKSGDNGVGELAFYVGNGLRSPAVGRLERVLLARLPRLKGTAEEDDEDIDLSSAARRARRMRELRAVLKRFDGLPSGGNPASHNAEYARTEFGLDAIEMEILLLLLRYERNGGVRSLVDDVENKFDSSATDAIAALTAAERREVEARLGREARLAACGLLHLDPTETGIGPCSFVHLSQPLRRVMFRRFRTRAAWINALAGAPLKAELAWQDFAHLGESADLARHVLIGAVRAKASGINILFHGPVGTGKTEFCKVLAAEAGLSLRAVAEEDDQSGEPSRCERLASLKLLQRLLSAPWDRGRPARMRAAGPRSQGIILFDEAEDLLEQPGAFFGMALGERSGSKVHMNRLIEANPVPVLWTCNEVARIDPAVLRRMTLAIEVKTPAVPARLRIWRRALALARVTLDDTAIARLAERFEAPAAVAANAARAAALAGGGENEIERALSGVLSLLELSPRPASSDALAFDPNLINCAEDMAELTARLTRADAPRNWSLCLSGPPGTGKSEYARHLAKRLGLETLRRRASDLLSMWVGGSEKQIAAAFAQARDTRAMLIIDEADSLLGDRRGAVRSWEVTQVNEMLTWMENHPLPFVCTTNMMERLDQASLRRFTLKLRFEPLTRTQAARMFEHAFGLSAPEALPDDLTPGDFATVRRRRALFGETNAARLIEWLAAEVESRGVPARRIGFAP